MPIPVSQLDTWARQGATTSASQTYTAVKAALDSFAGWRAPITYEVYLQGSYRNDTQIRAESDVDVVVELTTSYFWDISRMTLPEQGLFKTSMNLAPASYLWEHFRQDVLSALQSYFGQNSILAGSKSVKIKPRAGLRNADVIPSMKLLSYRSFVSPAQHTSVAGIMLVNQRNGQTIFSYPKQHYDNGVAKNRLFRTSGNFKQFIRLFKNLRSHLVERQLIQPGLASSFFVESLLYNVPDELFTVNKEKSCADIVNWLRGISDKSQFVCQSGQYLLFFESPGFWSQVACNQFLDRAVDIWNAWS